MKRFARVVEKMTGRQSGLTRQEGVELLQREHAAVRRKVKAMRKDGAEFGSENYGYNKACADLLAWLDERGR